MNMKKIGCRTTAVFFMLALAPCVLDGSESQISSDQIKSYESDARSVSDVWLHLVDEGKYSESWIDTAEIFRSSISQNVWTRQMKNSRAQMGKLLERKVVSTEFSSSLPGVPDGKYVVITYRSSFENKKTAVETVTPMLEKDGKWRVSGYYIQ